MGSREDGFGLHLAAKAAEQDRPAIGSRGSLAGETRKGPGCRFASPRGADLSASRVLTMAVVSAEQIDDYLRGVEEPKRSTLQALRRTILDVIPDAEQTISYGVPAFRMQGTTVAGYTMTKGSLHFPVDRPLPKALVTRLIAMRLSEADRRTP
jgi:uncharacterized protein YdhG (YjbR/CyaY superfamily)